MNKKIFLIFLLFSSCCKVSNKIEPKITYSIEEKYIENMTSPFPPLTEEEKKEDWGKEYLIASFFAKSIDLYRAISTYKRAKILLGDKNLQRKQEIEHLIILSYFLGKKYKDVINNFESSSLKNVDKSFPTFSDLLVILYESYKNENLLDKKEAIEKVLSKDFPSIYEKLQISSSIFEANLDEIKELSIKKKNDQLNNFLKNYNEKKKSISQAQFLNAILPGAGYFYLGQKRSAITSILLNGSFIAASYEFFRRGYIAAGIITTSFEMGWYFGGIYGAGEEAKFYNERIYEEEANTFMKKERLYPFFNLRYSF